MRKQEIIQDNLIEKLFFDHRVRKAKKKCIKNNSFWNREIQDQRMTQSNFNSKSA